MSDQKRVPKSQVKSNRQKQTKSKENLLDRAIENSKSYFDGIEDIELDQESGQVFILRSNKRVRCCLRPDIFNRKRMLSKIKELLFAREYYSLLRKDESSFIENLKAYGDDDRFVFESQLSKYSFYSKPSSLAVFINGNRANIKNRLTEEFISRLVMGEVALAVETLAKIKRIHQFAFERDVLLASGGHKSINYLMLESYKIDLRMYPRLKKILIELHTRQAFDYSKSVAINEIDCVRGEARDISDYLKTERRNIDKKHEHGNIIEKLFFRDFTRRRVFLYEMFGFSDT